MILTASTSAALTLFCLLAASASAATLEQASRRMDADVAAGRPLVAHVVVVLVDNQHQGIVPVPAARSGEVVSNAGELIPLILQKGPQHRGQLTSAFRSKWLI